MIHKKGTWELPEQQQRVLGTVTVGMHPLSRRFHAILTELGQLHDLKQQDYGRANDPFANVRGSEEWGVQPWIGAMVRAYDKMKRLQKVARGGTLANEGIIDSFNDLAVHTVIARCLYEESSSFGQETAPAMREQDGLYKLAAKAWDIPRG